MPVLQEMISKGRRREGGEGKAEVAGLSSIPGQPLLPDTLTLLPCFASLPRRPPGFPGEEAGWGEGDSIAALPGAQHSRLLARKSGESVLGSRVVRVMRELCI